MIEIIEAHDESFRIDNDNTADWALRTISSELAERDRLIKIAEDQIAELQEQITALNEKYNNKTKFLKSCLAEYFATVPHKSTKTQESYKLLSGSLVLKKESQKIVHDDEKLIAYLKANDGEDFIKIKESVDWAGFKKSLSIVGNDVVDTELGCIVEACSVEDVPASFDIKF